MYNALPSQYPDLNKRSLHDFQDFKGLDLLLRFLGPGRKLVRNVVRILPSQGNKPEIIQVSATKLQSKHTGGKTSDSLRMAAAGHELFLLVHESDRGVGKRLAD